ncbi:MAG: Ig-like domain-containing protein [Candidatus Poribacteria bacterium]|nr:Ig-like domain-containing protein [Candidatus Poribacteria bacterium]
MRFWLMIAVFILAGCGGDDDSLKDIAPVVEFLSANPPIGATLTPNAIITLTFDNPPTDVRIRNAVVIPSGKTAIVTGPFDQGALSLMVHWDSGSTTLTYLVSSCCPEPPRVSGGSVRDRDMDVDPDAINSAGKIEIQFSEEVMGYYIVLQTGSGEDLGWLGKFEGTKGILELVKGRELRNHTAYVIVGKVADVKGNELEFRIVFVTREKE